MALESLDLADNDFVALDDEHASLSAPAGIAPVGAIPKPAEEQALSELHSEIPEIYVGKVEGWGGEAECIDAEPLNSNDEPVQLSNPRLLLKRISPTKSETQENDIIPSDTDGSSESYDDDTDNSEDIEEQFVEFTNFPVQVSLLEKAEGTMDTLLDDEDEEDPTMVETKEARWAAWLFQVIAGLAVAQHYFGFVHNDLHTNNVMWNRTELTHLYYKIVKGKETWTMRVPTFGRLMKIIDFGRASFTLPEAGFFISDAFFPGNDASTQYNCDPFYDELEGKRVEPNPSFDLSRLSISMIEALYPERPTNATPVRIMSKEGGKIYAETVSPVYNMLWEWLTDDQGKNVLRTPKGEERYPDFDLYRALAADVHNAVPWKQIQKAVFASYRCVAADVPAGAEVFELILPTQ